MSLTERESDDPMILAKAREEETRRRFIQYCHCYGPYADMFTLGARFAILEVDKPFQVEPLDDGIG